MKIMLIGGHGAGDSGAVSTIGGVNYREQTENEKVVAGIAKALAGFCDVTCYPESQNAYYDYKNGSLADFSGYDYVLEIHFNAFVASGADGKTKGTEILVRPTQKDNALAEKLVDAVSRCGLTNRGLKTSNLAVIGKANGAGVPAALLEICFIDDPDDMKIYLANQEKICQVIAAEIMDYFGLKKEVVPLEIYNTLEQIPDWGKATIAKLVSKGFLTGDGQGFNLSLDMIRIFVIHDRAGMYDSKI